MSEWISVKDRLPDSHTEVIVCDGDGCIVIGYIENINGDLRCNHGDDWLYFFTHWMPLPDLPKVD